MRSWRRGTKEMDLILGPFAEAQLADMAEGDLVLFDVLLGESDTDLYPWITGQAEAPFRLQPLLEQVRQHIKTR